MRADPRLWGRRRADAGERRRPSAVRAPDDAESGRVPRVHDRAVASGKKSPAIACEIWQSGCQSSIVRCTVAPNQEHAGGRSVCV